MRLHRGIVRPLGMVLAAGISIASLGDTTRAGALSIPVKSFRAPGGPTGIVTGPDGNLWYTSASGRIGRVKPDGVVNVFRTQTGSEYYIAPGPTGNVWFTSPYEAFVGRMKPDGTLKEFPIPSGSYAEGIVSGPDGNLWYCATERNRIGRLTPSGILTEFALPTTDAAPTSIVAGPDGNLWFTERDASAIGRITTGGIIDEFDLPVGNYTPKDITLGSDGELWFIDAYNGVVLRMTPTNTPDFDDFDPPGESIQALTAAPDGRIWFVSEYGESLGSIAPNGTIRTAQIGLLGGWELTTGPDGNLWISNDIEYEIARAKITTPGIVDVLAMDAGFVPARAFLKMGDSARWFGYGASSTQIESSVPGLFTSPGFGPSETMLLSFHHAGSYQYRDRLNGSDTGTIAVPVNVSPRWGHTSDTFTIQWATAAPGTNQLFDVQVKRPGGSYEPWVTGVAALSDSFQPDAGIGKYSFRARLRDTIAGDSSGWSPGESITVR